MDNWLIAIISSVSTVSLIGVLGFLSKSWIQKRIQYSIKHEYDKKLSNIEHERAVQLKAELIADLLSEWISKDTDYQRLNDLTFKAFLWLPPELANDLSNSLNHQKRAIQNLDAPDDTRELIVKVRKHLLGQQDTFLSQNVIVFSDPEKKHSKGHSGRR